MYELFHYFFPEPSAMNSTACRTFLTGESVCLPPIKVPFYFAVRQNLLDGIPDVYIALAVPVLAYWSMSLVFHGLDISGWRWLDKYRIHESEEIKSKNLATLGEVVRAVVIQHIMQTVLGLAWLSEPAEISITRCQSEMEHLGRTLAWVVQRVMGEETGLNFLNLWGPEATHWLYWWGIPAAQILFALYVLSEVSHEVSLIFSRFLIDTWLYFIHRLMHTNKYIYRKVHSMHHRLYVPYAFGASYNHPVEVFLLDTLGAIIAETFAGLTIRQAIFVFTFTTCKNVDDHCGYSLPFDPFQMMSGNTADYHDIHHQVCLFTVFLTRSVLMRRIDYWHQVQLLTTFLHPLGHPPWHSHD